jgi:small-conductance mechanosensitive channel
VKLVIRLPLLFALFFLFPILQGQSVANSPLPSNLAAPSVSLAKSSALPSASSSHRSLMSASPTLTPDESVSAQIVPQKVVKTPQAKVPQKKESSVVYLGDHLFYIYADSAVYSAAQRAQIVTKRIDEFAHNLTSSPPVVQQKGNLAFIQSGDVTLMTITDKDAEAAQLSVNQLADFYAIQLKQAIRKGQVRYNLISILINIGIALAITLALFALIWAIRRVFPKVYDKVDSLRKAFLPDIRVRDFVLVSSDRLADFFLICLKLLRNGIILLLLYFYFPLVFSLFPWTRNLSGTLLNYFTKPLYKGWLTVINYIPNLFVIVIIAVFTFYALKVVKLVFKALDDEIISYPGFHKEWALPTYSIVRFLILAFAVVVVFPYLPGSDSPAFKSVSLFLGILFSLGSTSAISNMVAGVVLTYMRSFRLGDRVKIGDAVGDVIEKNLLVTRIRTPKNVVITVPNSSVLSSHIINYSSEDGGSLILHTTVTIGYDVPWPKVHELLLAAAAKTENVLAEPKSFILQTSLDDFYVSYELNVYTDNPHKMPRIYSDLHQHIQDLFNEGGVEILSPHYSALRDGNQVTIPESYLPGDYQAPAFRVFPWQKP